METERLIGHMSRVGLRNVGFDDLMPRQSMLIVVATGDAWRTFDLKNEIILSGDTQTVQATVDPAVVFDDTLVVTDV